MTVTLREIKKNPEGISGGGNEANIHINNWEHKGEKSIQSEQQEEKRIKKSPTKNRIRRLWDISKHTNI